TPVVADQSGRASLRARCPGRLPRPRHGADRLPRDRPERRLARPAHSIRRGLGGITGPTVTDEHSGMPALLNAALLQWLEGMAAQGILTTDRALVIRGWKRGRENPP